MRTCYDVTTTDGALSAAMMFDANARAFALVRSGRLIAADAASATAAFFAPALDASDDASDERVPS